MRSELYTALPKTRFGMTIFPDTRHVAEPSVPLCSHSMHDSERFKTTNNVHSVFSAPDHRNPQVQSLNLCGPQELPDLTLPLRPQLRPFVASIVLIDWWDSALDVQRDRSVGFMRPAIEQLGEHPEVGIFCPVFHHRFAHVLKGAADGAQELMNTTATVFYMLRDSPAWLGTPESLEMLVALTAKHLAAVRWPSAEALFPLHPTAASSPFPRLRPESVQSSLHKFVVDRLNELEIWTGMQKLDQVPRLVEPIDGYIDEIQAALLGLCILVLAGDVARLDPSQLPAFARPFVTSDEALDLHFEHPNHCYMLAWRYDSDLSWSARKVLARGFKIDQRWASSLAEDTGHATHSGPFARARFLTTERWAAETVQAAMDAFHEGKLPHFSINVAESLCEALEMTRQLPGIYLELGVYKGSSAFVVLQYLRRAWPSLQRPALLVDTFEGFSSPQAAASLDMGWHGTHEAFGSPAEHMMYLRDLLSPMEVPFSLFQANVLTDDLPAAEGVALCLIDVDTFEATLSALRKVKPLLVPGGVVLLEDVTATPFLTGALAALDLFLEEQGQSFLRLCTRSMAVLIRVDERWQNRSSACAHGSATSKSAARDLARRETGWAANEAAQQYDEMKVARKALNLLNYERRCHMACA
ncbi:unnamed protein product [Effrenium voratum]|uniref:Uncharacterized protein n=1 Tax=Effrenium voratum TaxID=2562239 RepID=A0AA36ISR2_9DINO|nr:unnamed protein product [Effrenium voratum]